MVVKKPKYAYHISGNKGHDSAFTLLVTKDLMEQFDGAKRFPLFRIKSDNCNVPYCSFHVFEAYLKLSKSISQPIILYYDVNEHDKGLVDAISGFGVKTPFRRAIVTDNFYFINDV